MDAEKVLKLIEAGFSAEEVRSMLSPSAISSPAAATPKSAPAPEQSPAEEKAAEEAKPERSTEDIINEKMKEAFQPFADLYSKMSKLAGMPEMAKVEPKGIDDVISNFFKEAK